MKPVTWNMPGLRWGDKNLRWGSPSYLLEFSDPGWVYDPNSLSQPPPTPVTNTNPRRKKKAMPKSPYIKAADAAFAAQMLQFKNNIGSYATTVGVTVDEVTAQAADADYFAYVLACQDVADSLGQQWTTWKDITRYGGAFPPSGAPLPPVFPTAVAAVLAGIEKRFRDLVQRIKKHKNYNPAIGEALGIEGAESAPPPPGDFQPLIRLEIVGGQVVVRWGWEGKSAFLDSLEIEVDRGSGFQFLTIDTTPGYTDTTPLPATAQKWTYRAIFRVGDSRTGQWSTEVSITVAA